MSCVQFFKIIIVKGAEENDDTDDVPFETGSSISKGKGE